MNAQEKANFLKEKWEKANLFTDGELNTLGWKIAFPYRGTDNDYVQIVDEIWAYLKQQKWSDNECVVLMIGGERAQRMLRNL